MTVAMVRNMVSNANQRPGHTLSRDDAQRYVSLHWRGHSFARTDAQARRTTSADRGRLSSTRRLARIDQD